MRRTTDRDGAKPATRFVTKIKDADGRLISATSAQSLSDNSHRPDVDANERLLNALMAFFSCSEQNAPLPTPLLWMNMMAVMPGFVLPNPNAATSGTVSVPRFPLFKMIDSHHVSTILDAVMRGEEDIAMRAIEQNPKALLQKWKIKNHLGRTVEVTPLEAAVMTTDVQMIEKMKPYFEALTEDLDGNPIDDLAEFHRQIKETYKKSLQRYCDIQQEKIDALLAQQNNGRTIDTQALETAQARLASYKSALETDNFDTILKAHKWAQKFNAFNFQPYIDAICNAPDAELDDVVALINASTPEAIAEIIARTGVSATQTDAARAKPFDQLTLVEKLNRFREEFVAHMQREVIFNPNRILEGLTQNDRIWGEVNAGSIADPNYHKRMVIFSQLVGWAQRKAAEPVKQDIRQGTWYLAEENKPRTRQTHFNGYGRSFPDASLIDPCGVGGGGYAWASGVAGHGVLGVSRTMKYRMRPGVLLYGTGFQNLCRAKTANLARLCSAPSSSPANRVAPAAAP